jgi:hypothetical protein
LGENTFPELVSVGFDKLCGDDIKPLVIIAAVCGKSQIQKLAKLCGEGNGHILIAVGFHKGYSRFRGVGYDHLQGGDDSRLGKLFGLFVGGENSVDAFYNFGSVDYLAVFHASCTKSVEAVLLLEVIESSSGCGLYRKNRSVIEIVFVELVDKIVRKGTKKISLTELKYFYWTFCFLIAFKIHFFYIAPWMFLKVLTHIL